MGSTDRRSTEKAPPSVRISRRTLAKAAAAALVVPRHVLGGAGQAAPSETLSIAAVGIGGMGRHYLKGCEHERITALCDCDRDYARPVFETYPQAKRYRDFREMFASDSDRFDAVIVATPDHTHAVVLAEALALGKHVYCAKPITHTIHEARLVGAAVRAAGVVTQTSVQSAASEAARATEEMLRSGVLGPIREVHVWTPHPIYPCSMDRPRETPPVPEGLDWDLWLGPAPYRAYHPAYHPFKWRAWWDFGSGTVADMACHSFHVFFEALRLDQRTPTHVAACRSYHRDPSGGMVLSRECESDANQVTWRFPALGEDPEVSLHWYDGGMRPLRPAELDAAVPMPESGMLFVGRDGKMLSGFSGGGDFLLPSARFRDFRRPAPELPRTIGHYREWTEACKGNGRAYCPMELGCRMTELALLGTIALRVGVPDRPRKGWPAPLLEWDSERMRFPGSEEADGLVNPPCREPWTLKVLAASAES